MGLMGSVQKSSHPRQAVEIERLELSNREREWIDARAALAQSVSCACGVPLSFLREEMDPGRFVHLIGFCIACASHFDKVITDEPVPCNDQNCPICTLQTEDRA